jgi:NADH-quinone oxidoreductase subunit J
VGDVVFIALAVVVIVTAFWVVTVRNLVRAAISLMGTLFGMAGLYILLYADFLAATQVVIYVGGILVLIIFGVMLTHRVTSPVLIQGALPNRLLSGAIVFLIFIGLVVLLFRTPWYEGELMAGPTVKTIGQSLMTRYLLHFEVASVLLLLALLGAAYLSRREDG